MQIRPVSTESHIQRAFFRRGCRFLEGFGLPRLFHKGNTYEAETNNRKGYVQYLSGSQTEEIRRVHLYISTKDPKKCIQEQKMPVRTPCGGWYFSATGTG